MSITVSTKRAVGYLRVSSTGHTGERHSSLDAQKARFKEYCQRFDFLPVTTFLDVVIGKRDDRKEYRRMVDFVIQGCADVIIVQFLDRFGCNPREILQRYCELEDFGVSIVATDEDIQEELLLLLKAGIAGAESRRTSERVRSNMGRVVQKGVHAARPPYGLQPDREIINGHIDPMGAGPHRSSYCTGDVPFGGAEKGYKAIADKLSNKL